MRVSAWGVLAMLWLATEAAAEPRDPAAAQALFDDAVALMKTRAFAKACPKLAESQRLDPGIGTQFRLAECYEGQGLVASAWAQFLEVASLASASGQLDRQQAANKRASKLEPRLPRLRLNVAAANRAAGLQVERDGVLIREVTWDSPLPVDPGAHEIVAKAPGYRPFTTKVTAQEGQTSDVAIPPLEAVPAASTEAAPAVASPVPPPLAPPPAARPPEPAVVRADARPGESSGAGPIVVGLGAVGIVGVGAGAFLGFMAQSKFRESKDQCSPSNEDRCNASGVELRKSSISLANGATIAFVAGGAALAGAAILLLARPSSKPATSARWTAAVDAGPTHGNLVLIGRF